MIKIFFVLLLVFSYIQISYGYLDEDLDGVEDSIDKCPNTPFDVLVDRYGCPINDRSMDKLTKYFRTGLSYTYDKEYSNYLWDISFGLSYKNIYTSFSFNYYIYDSFLEESGLGDTYVYGSYKFDFENIVIIPGITLKIPTASKNFGDSKFDYTPSLYLDYIFKNFDIFIYYGFVFRGSSEFEDFHTVSLGFGFYIDKLYTSISYDFDGNNSKYLSLVNLYDLTDKYYLILNYSHGVSDFSIDNFLSLKLGVRF